MSWISFRRTLLPIPLLLVFINTWGCDLTGCGEKAVAYTFDFSTGAQGWTALFTNYYVGEEEWVEIHADYRTLPAPLDTTQGALFITGHNHPDDLNMLFKHQLGGLQPNTTYRITFEIEFATNVPAGLAGIGGAPGEAVTVHADAAPYEPEQVIDESMEPPYYRLNLVTNSGDQWYEDTKLGDITNTRGSEEEWVFELKTLKDSPPYAQARTDSEGRLWLVAGTRSGFEGVSSLYYTRIIAFLRKSG